MGRRISKEFLHPSILEGVNNKIGNLDSLETDAKGNMVQAINELVEKLDNSAEIENGKELIANAVGEPLTAEESFEEMSNDINGLLSQFKTNMMNNGITVESGDRFKSLIDKIATMVEEGSGKGIQYITGTGEVNTSKVEFTSKDMNYECRYIDLTFDFDPNIILVTPTKGDWFGGTINIYIKELGYVYISTYQMIPTNNFTVGIAIDSKVKKGNGIYRMPLYPNMSGNVMWYAIGVGEEDTTLRDSLASILENKGVDVTEEDDMARLISKVDEEFSNIKELSLYNRGDMCDKITGGWSFESNMNSAEYYIHEINEDHVYFWLRCNTDTGYVRMITNNLIDLTNYNSIFIEANGFVSETSSNHRVYIFLKSSDGTEVTLTDFLYPNSGTDSYSGKFINLADYKYLGNCYISVGLKMPRYASTNCQTGCNILKLMLSK